MYTANRVLDAGQRDQIDADPTQIITLAAVQELEREHQAARAQPVGQPAAVDVPAPDLTTPHGFDDQQRREQLRTRLVAAGVPEPAIEARTLADLGQAREVAEAAQTPVAAGYGPRPAAAHSARRELRQQGYW